MEVLDDLNHKEIDIHRLIEILQKQANDGDTHVKTAHGIVGYEQYFFVETIKK